MSELKPGISDDFFSGGIDEEAVSQYLEPPHSGEIVRLAAMLSPVPGTSDHEESVHQAAMLMDAAQKEENRIRERMLTRMNFETLHALLCRIGYNLPMLSQGRHLPEVNCPVKGPVFAMIARRLPGLPEDPRIQHEQKIENVILTASNRTTMPRPQLPCDLEPALRWAANAPSVPFKILKRAFRNHLETNSASEEEENDLRKRIEECRQAMKCTIGNSARAGEFKTEIKMTENHLRYLKDVKSHQSSFKPWKTGAPKHVARRVNTYFAEVWDKPECIQTKSTLAELCGKFHAFWQKHEKAYAKHAQTKSTTNSGVAPGGPISRMKPVWEARTESFLKFCKDRQIPEKGSNQWDSFFTAFAKTQPEQWRTQKIVAGFMRTLLPHAGEPGADTLLEELTALLKTEGIRAVDHETIRACLKRLSNAQPGLRRKKHSPTRNTKIQ